MTGAVNFEIPRTFYKEHRGLIKGSILVTLLAVATYLISGHQSFHFLIDKAHKPYAYVINKANSHIMKDHEEDEKLYNLTVRNAAALAEHITSEVDLLDTLYAERDAKKDTFLWFLDYEKQSRVDEVQMRINDQRRIILNEIEDLQLLRKRLKRHQGIFSKAFVRDLGVSILEIITRLHVLFPPFGFSLLTFLLLGPAVAAGMLLFVNLGMTLLPLFTCTSLVLWLMNFPTVLLQYDPTILQFLLCYIGSSVAVVSLVYSIIFAASPVGLLMYIPTRKRAQENWAKLRKRFIKWRDMRRTRRLQAEEAQRQDRDQAANGPPPTAEAQVEEDLLESHGKTE